MRCTLALVAFAALVATVAAAGSGPGTVTTPNGFKVDFVGQSGQIKLYTDDTKFLKVKWSKLQEVDLNGNVVVSVNNFASQDFSWTVVPGTNTNSTKATLSAVLDVGHGGNGFNANFAVSVEIYPQSTIVKNGDQDVSVPVDSVKFSVHVDGWAFSSTDNQLQFGCTINTPDNSAGAVKSTGEDGAVYSFGPGNLNVQNSAVVDGVNRHVNATLTSNGGNVGVDWQFPNFAHSLDYDPVLALNTVNGASTASSAVAVLVAMFAALCAMMQQ